MQVIFSKMIAWLWEFFHVLQVIFLFLQNIFTLKQKKKQIRADS